MIYENKDQLKKGCADIIQVDGSDVRILDEVKLKNELIDDLIYTAVFSPDKATQECCLLAYPPRRLRHWESCPLRFSLFMKPWEEAK